MCSTRPPWLHASATKVFVVGPATDAALRASTSWSTLLAPTAASSSASSTCGADCGHAAALAEVMVQTLPPASRVLFVCGRQRRDTLPIALSAAGHTVVEAVVYDSQPSGEVARAIEMLTGRLARDGDAPVEQCVLVFFSPACFDACAAHLAGLLRDPRVCLAAIGPTTATHIHEHGHAGAVLVAQSPAPHALASALHS